MPTAIILNLIGLFLGAVAALLMFYFPPRTTIYTEKGEGIIN